MKIAKKVIFIVLMILIFGATKAEAQTGKINYESIVLREGATTSSEALAEGYEGEEVRIIEKVDDWYKVEYKDKTGYIREDLIDLLEEENKKEEEIIEKQEEKPEEKQEEKQEEKIEEKQDEKQEEKKVEETSKKEEENNKQKENTVNPIGEKQLNKDTVCRIVPCIYSSKLGELKAGTKVTVQKVLGAWSLIKYEGNKSGWIPTKLLKEISNEEETKKEDQEEANKEYKAWTGYISVSAAIVRKEANTDSDIVAEVERNNSIEIIGETEDWYKVLYGEEEAYIAKRLVSDSITAEEASRNQANRNATEPEEETYEEVEEEYDEETTSIYADTTEEEVYEEPEQETYVPASSVGAEVVSKAMEYLGYDYVYGGSGPYSFDCSGFTMYIYSQFGVYMGHGATMQSSEGSYVSKDNLQPGDLLIFRDWDNEDIGHCGIYIGDGEFIHAANPSRGVVIDSIYSDYYGERYVSGRRVI